MGVIKEIWANDVQEVLRENSAFLADSTNHSAYITGRVVHVPQAGGDDEIVIGQTQLPLPIGQRTDTSLDYNIEPFRVPPQLVEDFDALQVSYDLKQSVMGSKMAKLAEEIGSYALNKWSSSQSDYIIRTSGTADANALAPGATGTRKITTSLDIRTLGKILDLQKVPLRGRKLIMSSAMYWQLFADADFKDIAIINTATLPDGVIARAYGFDIISRPTVATYDGSAALKAFRSAEATTDNLSCIAYHPSFVARALDQPIPRIDENKPEYYGTLFSLEQYFGASKLRTTQVGIAQLVQTA